ncbi:MAG: isoleucine-tRNA ligase, partial [Caulobacteraceae bacterium]|nr:isoleucine-tRNA ligase [Caulobacteraceae bacterium]
KRREKLIGSALEADVLVQLDKQSAELFTGLDAAETFRTSQANIEGSTDSQEFPVTIVHFRKAAGDKCDRCWRVLPEVKVESRLCLRCEAAVADWDATH